MTPSRRALLSVASWTLAIVLGAVGMYAANQKAAADAEKAVEAAKVQHKLAITQQRLAEERASRAAEELQSRAAEDEALSALRESADHGYMALDHEGRVTKWNPALEKWTGYTAAEMLGQTLERVMGSEEFRNHSVSYPAWIATDQKPISTLRITCRLIHKDGRTISVEVTARKVPSSHPRQPPYAIGLIDRTRNVLDLTK